VTGRADRDGAISRRQLLTGTGAVGTGMVAASVLWGSVDSAAGASTGSATIPFYGPHQAGIVTPAQPHLVFAAYDLTASDRSVLATLLATWTEASARMTAGALLGGASGPDDPPPDTGEARGLGPSNLTLTVGFGPGVFDDRFGLDDRRPAGLEELPPFPGDALDPARSGGDVCVQACADDVQVAFHAVHNLTRLGLGAATLRYYQVGFVADGATGPPGGPQTPRNLLGFHDGTANRSVEAPGALDRFVWVGGDSDRRWMHGGTYLVARRVRTFLEAWSRTSLEDQEDAIGRYKVSGAPLGGSNQFDQPNFAAIGSDGQTVIPEHAHIRQAAPASNGGQQILRRSYSFADGIDPLTGEIDAGLFFVCFQRDPRRQFVRIQERLSSADTLTGNYLLHTGSAVFACPPGLRPGQHWGEVLGLP
jgi:deferrochelatase/peroxidase EfeB